MTHPITLLAILSFPAVAAAQNLIALTPDLLT